MTDRPKLLAEARELDGRIDVRPTKTTSRRLGTIPAPCPPDACNNYGFVVGNVFNIYYCTKCGGNQDWL